MNKQEIITLLIKDYTEAIEKCKGMRYKGIHDYLYDANLHEGICLAAYNKYRKLLANKKWIKRHNDFSFFNRKYWYDIPFRLTNKKQIIACLQYRLNILKQELEIPE